jgi:hypothetical protein
MALLTFKDWRKAQNESSPQTRLMNGPYRSLSASPFSRSTPSPAVVKDLLDDDGNLKSGRRKKKRKRKKGKKGTSSKKA